jgi:nitrite reductase/ring-hydroxylating ferredoxin subunit
MERRSFLRLSGMGTCAAATGMLSLAGCASIPHVLATAGEGGWRVRKDAFAIEGKDSFRRSIIVEVQGLEAPVIVYRNGDQDHIALLMRCTHKNAELNVSGDQLTCPAHGSAFSNSGAVLEGPASQPLKRFPVTYAGGDLVIATQ